MEPHRIERDGTRYEIAFERAPEGWLARIRKLEDGTVHVVAFADGVGYDSEDPRGSLIAGCEAAIERLPWAAPTRH